MYFVCLFKTGTRRVAQAGHSSLALSCQVLSCHSLLSRILSLSPLNAVHRFPKSHFSSQDYFLPLLTLKIIAVFGWLPRDLGRAPLGPKSCLLSLLPRSQRSCLSYSPGARRQLTSGRRRWTGYSLVSHCGNANRREGHSQGTPGHCLYVVARVHDPRNPGCRIPGSYTWYVLTVLWNNVGLCPCI